MIIFKQYLNKQIIVADTQILPYTRDLAAFTTFHIPEGEFDVLSDQTNQSTYRTGVLNWICLYRGSLRYLARLMFFSCSSLVC